MGDQFEWNRFFVGLEFFIVVMIFFFVYVDNRIMQYLDNELEVKVCVLMDDEWRMICFEFEQNRFFLVDNRIRM